MNRRWRAVVRLLILLLVFALLFLLFPPAFAFAQGAARSVFRLWWLVLLVALAIWLIWGVGKKPKD